MDEPTKRQKLDALMECFPKMSFQAACELLGYDLKDPEVCEGSSVDWLKNMFGMK